MSKHVTSRRPATSLLAAGILASLTLLGGCVERVMHITSEPEGALVFLNDDEVGKTPVDVPFTYYGTYDVRLEKEGYQPLWIMQKAEAPWWEFPGPDLAAEAIPENKVDLHWHFKMEARGNDDEGSVIERARQMRAIVAPQGAPGGAPAAPTTKPKK